MSVPRRCGAFLHAAEADLAEAEGLLLSAGETELAADVAVVRRQAQGVLDRLRPLIAAPCERVGLTVVEGEL